MLKIVSATRRTAAEFTRSPLYQSIERIKAVSTVLLDIATENKEGLPKIYNRAIETAGDMDILVFVHDDVWILDWFLEQRLLNAFAYGWGIVGLAGNNRRLPDKTVAWHVDKNNLPDVECLSGAVGHGTPTNNHLSRFGAVPTVCCLMDGLFLAAQAYALRESGLRFDEQFKFHFYDLDFCRYARTLGFTLGTWPIAVVHESVGNYNTESWREGLKLYSDKWQLGLA